MARQKQLNDKAVIEVFNNSGGVVAYYSELNRINRRWDKPETVRKISLEELKELVNSSGGYELLCEDLLIKEIDVRLELGLPVDPEYLMGEKEIKELLSQSIHELKSSLSASTKAFKERVAAVAVDVKITDTDKMELIQRHTGVDVYALIKERKENEKTD